MTIDSWVRKRMYDAFREFVGSGMNYHLQVYILIMDLFYILTIVSNITWVTAGNNKGVNFPTSSLIPGQ